MGTSFKPSGIPAASRRLALEPPVVPVRDDVKFIIPIEHLENDLLVEVPKGAEFRNSLSIQLYVNNDFEDRSNFRGDPVDLASHDLTDPTLTKFEVYYSKSQFPADGTDVTESLNYFLFDTDAESYEAGGTAIPVRFDRLAAGGEELPTIYFTPEQLTGITSSHLDAEGKLNISVSPYYLAEDQDSIEMWIGDSRTNGTYLQPPFLVSDPTRQIPTNYTREQLDAAGDARTLFFGYRVTDLAGNISRMSNLVAIPVFINLPDLGAPVVPAAEARGLVTYNDANPSLVVEIPRYTGAAVEDLIVVSWAGTEGPSYSLTQADIDRDPLLPITSIDVPFALVALGGNGSVKASYEMRRANNPPVPSPGADVPVDLTTPGGPNPDPDPDKPEHGNIKVPSVLVGTSAVNTISPADFGKDGVATAYRQGNDLAPIWLVGDVIQMYWGTVSNPEIASRTVTASNEGANIDVPIPFEDVIEAVGVGQIAMYFTVTRQLPVPEPGTGTVPVTVKSQVQTVNVSSSDALPGDGGPLRPASFPEANARNIITLAVGTRGTFFRIPLDGVTNIDPAKNPRVSYEFIGLTSGDADAPSGDPIEESRINGVDVPLTPQHLTQEYVDVPLPYAKTYFICRNGATVNYSLANDMGRNSNAPQAFVRFAMNRAGGTCDLPTQKAHSGMPGTGLLSQPPRQACNSNTTSAPVLPPIAFTQEQRDGISDEDLERGVLVSSVSPYGGMKRDDLIEPWVGTSTQVDSGHYLKSTSTVGNPGSVTPITFTRADLLATGNRTRLFFGYRVTSSDGTISGLSALVPIIVNLSE